MSVLYVTLWYTKHNHCSILGKYSTSKNKKPTVIPLHYNYITSCTVIVMYMYSVFTVKWRYELQKTPKILKTVNHIQLYRTYSVITVWFTMHMYCTCNYHVFFCSQCTYSTEQFTVHIVLTITCTVITVRFF